MLFSRNEKQVAQMHFIEGLSASKIEQRGVSRGTFTRARRQILVVLKTVGINTDCPRDVSEALAVLLRRQDAIESQAVAA